MNFEYNILNNPFQYFQENNSEEIECYVILGEPGAKNVNGKLFYITQEAFYSLIGRRFPVDFNHNEKQIGKVEEVFMNDKEDGFTLPSGNKIKKDYNVWAKIKFKKDKNINIKSLGASLHYSVIEEKENFMHNDIKYDRFITKIEPVFLSILSDKSGRYDKSNQIYNSKNNNLFDNKKNIKNNKINNYCNMENKIEDKKEEVKNENNDKMISMLSEIKNSIESLKENKKKEEEVKNEENKEKEKEEEVKNQNNEELIAMIKKAVSEVLKENNIKNEENKEKEEIKNSKNLIEDQCKSFNHNNLIDDARKMAKNEIQNYSAEDLMNKLYNN